MKSSKILTDQFQEKKLKISKKDYDKISQWYDAFKRNYCQTTGIETKVQESKQVQLRLYFSQIYLTDLFIDTHFDVLRNLLPKPLLITGGIYKSQDQQFQGKPYESKFIEVQYNMNTKSLILGEEMNFFTYCYETKKRDCIFYLEFSIVNNENQQFRVGKLEFNINSPLSQISQLKIYNKKGQQVGFIQSIIQKQPIRDISVYLSPNTIIDQNIKIPCLKSFQIKKSRKDAVLLDDRTKITLQGIRIQIRQFGKMKEKLQKNNPYTSYHYETVDIDIRGFRIYLGTHNSYKFVDFDKEVSVFQLIDSSKQDEKNSDVLVVNCKDKEKIIQKTYFDCSKTVFLMVLIVEVRYTYNQFVNTKFQTVGWCVIPNRLYEQKLNYQTFLQNMNSLPGFPIQINHQGIKLTVELTNPQYKKFPKKSQDQYQMVTTYKDIFSDDKQNQLLTKTVFVKRQATQSFKNQLISNRSLLHMEQSSLEVQLKEVVQRVQQQLEKKSNKIVVRGNIFGQDQNNTGRNQITNTDWEHVLGLQNKILKVGLKLSSIIPTTDEKSYLQGKYYLPRNFKVKAYLMRKIIELQGTFTQNYASFNIPSFVKSKKQFSFMQIAISNKKQISKLLDSSLIVNITDTQNHQFYAKGYYRAAKILASKEGTKINVELEKDDSKMGQLVLEIVVNVRSQDKSYKKEIVAIQKDKILQSLPMKQRMMMRISNFNKSSKEMQNKAIELYKQKTHMNVINKITNQQISNLAVIHYELGEPSYYLIDFKNTSSSQNNIFTFFIKNCEYAEIVTDENQYKQACLDKKFEIVPYHKITFHGENVRQKHENSYYSSKILQHQQIGVLIKVMLQEWQQNIAQQSNFIVEICRNTMPVLSHKFKLVFNPPIIHEIVTLYEITPQPSRHLAFNLPLNIYKKYETIVSLSKNLDARHHKNDFKVKMEKFAYRVEFLVQGKILPAMIGDQTEPKIQNVLIEVYLMDGEVVQCEVGHVMQKDFDIDTKSNRELSNGILIVPERSIGNIVSLDKSVYLLSQQPESIKYTLCSFDAGVCNVVISFMDLKYNIKYQYLLKVFTKLKTTPFQIMIENFIGQKASFQFANPYVTKSKFLVLTNHNKSIRLDRDSLCIDPQSSERIVLQLVNKLDGRAFIAVYDDHLGLIRLYELIFQTEREKAWKLMSQIQ